MTKLGPKPKKTFDRGPYSGFQRSVHYKTVKRLPDFLANPLLTKGKYTEQVEALLKAKPMTRTSIPYTDKELHFLLDCTFIFWHLLKEAYREKQSNT